MMFWNFQEKPCTFLNIFAMFKYFLASKQQKFVAPKTS